MRAPRTGLQPPPPACRQRGFGLLEMMVALVLGLLVVGAATAMFVATRRANTTSENLSRMQEAVRTSYDLMTREVREAGATPCDAAVLVTDVLNAAQGATPAWWAPWNEGAAQTGMAIRGFDGAVAFPPAATGTAVAQRVAETDAVMVRYGAVVDGVVVTAHSAVDARFTVTPANHGIGLAEQLLVCNYGQGAIFNVTAINTFAGTFDHAVGAGSAENCSRGLGLALPTLCTTTGTPFQFPAGSRVARYIAAGWYIGNNGRPETGGRSLYRITRSGAEEVAEGVRDMQITYLVAGAANYVAAGAVAAADWERVVALRFDLTYEGPDTNAVTTTANAARLTRTVSFTVSLRNLQS